jgi:hypothetical protein
MTNRRRPTINLTLDARLIETIKSNSAYTGESISHRVERLLVKDIKESVK